MADPKITPDHKAAAVSGRKAYSPEEAAATYGVGRSLIYEHLAAGLLTAKKAGARTLIAASVLDAWFENLPASSKAKRHEHSSAIARLAGVGSEAGDESAH